ELGKGTKVNIRFELELAPDKVPELKDQKEQDTEDALQGKKVLLVEDHPINAEIAEKLLTRKGVIVTCAENGKIAVDRFIGYEEGFFDAVLMDVRMPVMDGLEATHIIRSLDRADAQKIPIIAMTANAFDEDRDATLQAGMVAHIAKPISPKELYSTLINNILV
ncbi:MAG: response regulator, partial [Acidaminococcaceae bacterium]